MNKVEGVIFDWAGTTVDFGCFAPVNIFLEIFKKKGIEVTMVEARAPMGMLKRDHIKAMLQTPGIREMWKEKYGRDFNEKDIDDLYSDFKPLLMASLEEYTDPIPEVINTVRILRKSGIKIGSTTGYTDEMMKIVTAGAKKNGYEPDYFVTPDATNSIGRPYPYMIFKNIENLGLMTSWKVVKVGDTISDIKEGINAGVWSVGVVVGSSQMGLSYDEFINFPDNDRDEVIKNTEASFLKAGADFTIKTMVELPGLIERINKLINEGKRPNAK
ncbi:phosphonoacetaldehyde hydrolase [Clostridium estertheticum]|uniref:phosphonoacetaldehyde hydrolase n=1 Tax=Clostridium estertheticum TaxID=238834 RepID=UPI001CF4D0DA|nr:phosphonoacetaldehyde hydrolase [Clostridium estertheticum]MCB2361217.1 phosphonoacetaldehyde hydrolase [Clostridium estertheticum]